MANKQKMSAFNKMLALYNDELPSIAETNFLELEDENDPVALANAAIDLEIQDGKEAANRATTLAEHHQNVKDWKYRQIGNIITGVKPIKKWMDDNKKMRDLYDDWSDPGATVRSGPSYSIEDDPSTPNIDESKIKVPTVYTHGKYRGVDIPQDEVRENLDREIEIHRKRVEDLIELKEKAQIKKDNGEELTEAETEALETSPLELLQIVNPTKADIKLRKGDAGGIELIDRFSPLQINQLMNVKYRFDPVEGLTDIPKGGLSYMDILNSSEYSAWIPIYKRQMLADYLSAYPKHLRIIGKRHFIQEVFPKLKEKLEVQTGAQESLRIQQLIATNRTIKFENWSDRIRVATASGGMNVLFNPENGILTIRSSANPGEKVSLSETLGDFEDYLEWGYQNGEMTAVEILDLIKQDFDKKGTKKNDGTYAKTNLEELDKGRYGRLVNKYSRLAEKENSAAFAKAVGLARTDVEAKLKTYLDPKNKDPISESQIYEDIKRISKKYRISPFHEVFSNLHKLGTDEVYKAFQAEQNIRRQISLKQAIDDSDLAFVRDAALRREALEHRKEYGGTGLSREEVLVQYDLVKDMINADAVLKTKNEASGGQIYMLALKDFQRLFKQYDRTTKAEGNESVSQRKARILSTVIKDIQAKIDDKKNGYASGEFAEAITSAQQKDALLLRQKILNNRTAAAVSPQYWDRDEQLQIATGLALGTGPTYAFMQRAKWLGYDGVDLWNKRVKATAALREEAKESKTPLPDDKLYMITPSIYKKSNAAKSVTTTIAMDAENPGHVDQVLDALSYKELNTVSIDGVDKTADFEITNTTTVRDLLDQLSAKNLDDSAVIKIGQYELKPQTIVTLVTSTNDSITFDTVLDDEGQRKLMWGAILHRANQASDLNTLDRSLHQLTYLTKEEREGFDKLVDDLVGHEYFKNRPFWFLGTLNKEVAKAMINGVNNQLRY